MPLKSTIFLLFFAVSLVSCRPDVEYPPPPRGTVFPSELAPYGSSDTDSTGSNGGQNAQKKPVAGFRAVIQSVGDTESLEAAGATVVAVSAAGLVTFTPGVPAGTTLHNFQFSFFNPSLPVDTYTVIPLDEWSQGGAMPSSKTAGFQYLRGDVMSPQPSASTNAKGSITVWQITDRQIAARYSGTVELQGETLQISAEFNVPVQEQ